MTSTRFKGAVVLVVGGAGFVGSNLVLHLIKEEAGRIVIVDNLLSSNASNIPIHPSVEFIQGSVSDQRVLNKITQDIDYVWHLACYHGNQSSIADPIADHDNNTITSLMLFEHLSKTSKPQKVVYAAAGCAVAEKTFDDAEATTEDAPISLFHDSPYSISKIIGEMYGNYYFIQTGFPFVKARFQNIYGPREILGAGQWRGTPATVWRNVIPTFIWKALHNEPLILEGEGETSRDFIYVDDICRGLLACALYGEPGEAYNLASGQETTIKELAEIVIRQTKSESPLELVPRRNWDHSGKRYGSTIKAKKELGFEATVQISLGIKKTVEWTLDHKREIFNSMARHESFMVS